MTQQTRSKIVNILIVVFILLSIVATCIYCAFSTRDNLFNVVKASCDKNSQVEVIVNEYVSNKRFLLASAKPKNKLWTNVICKPAKQQSLEGSAKEIIIKNNSTYYAYNISLKNPQKTNNFYTIAINGLDDNFDVLVGKWNDKEFKQDQSLLTGVVLQKSNENIFIIINKKQTIAQPIQQHKSFSIDIKTSKTQNK